MKDNGRLVLVYPRVGADARKVSLHPPLPLLYLAGVLGDYSVAIFDERTDEPEKFDKLLDEGPVCVGFSIFTGPQIKYALPLAEKVKQHNIPTVFGGIHATILPEQTQRDGRVDYVVSGDGEFAFRGLVRDLEARRPVEPVTVGEQLRQNQLDKLPRLPYELVEVENYVSTGALTGRSLPFLFSRGCPYACTFCCNPVLGQGRWETMSVDAAMEQLDFIVDEYRLDAIFFQDENLMVNTETLNELAQRIGGRFCWGAQVRADAILKYDLAFLEQSGARYFGIGLESGSDRILRQIKKQETVKQFIEANRRLAQTNIKVWYNYITGFPGESDADLKMTIELGLRMLDENEHADNNTFYLLTPYPGTEIGSELADEMPDKLEGWAEFGRHNYNARWHRPEQMETYRRIGFSSKFVGRRLQRMFPDDDELNELAAAMTEKWRCFDFDDDKQWDQLTDRGWRVLRRFFGEHAY